MHPLHASANNAAAAWRNRAAALLVPNAGTPDNPGGLPLVAALATPIPYPIANPERQRATPASTQLGLIRLPFPRA
jgi:hypothetical protein